MKSLLVSLSMLTLVVAAPARAAEPRNLAARSSTGATMDNVFTAWIIPTGFGYGGWGWGGGVRYQKVVVPEGFLRSTSVHDELGIEGGVDFIHASWNAGIYYDYYGIPYNYTWSYNEITPVIGAAWNVWLSQNLALYPKLDFGFRIGSWSDNLGYSVATPSGYGGPLLEGAVGMIVKFDNLALRAEIGNYALRLGAGFNF